MPISRVFPSYRFSNAFGWMSDSLIFVAGFVEEDERFLVGDRGTFGFVSKWKNLSPKKKKKKKNLDQNWCQTKNELKKKISTEFRKRK